MRGRPTIDELRRALADFERTADGSAPSYAFYRRVADNVAALIAREETEGPAAEAAALDLLGPLVGQEGDVAGLTARLARAIREGGVAHGDPRLLTALRKITRTMLAIDNPRYASLRRDTGEA